MKRIIYIAAVTLCLSSCTKTPEQKAESLIQEEMQKTLFHPDTYVAEETSLDSAFAPYDDPDFYEKSLKFVKLNVAVNKYDAEASHQKSSMAIWGGPYQDAFDRNHYREAKDKYNKAIANRDNAIKEANELREELKRLLEQKETFIGFSAIHSYHANNNAGQTVAGNIEFIFDKEMKEIIAEYDMDGEEYQAVSRLYKEMRGESSMADGIDLDD